MKPLIYHSYCNYFNCSHELPKALTQQQVPLFLASKAHGGWEVLAYLAELEEAGRQRNLEEMRLEESRQREVLAYMADLEAFEREEMAKEEAQGMEEVCLGALKGS